MLGNIDFWKEDNNFTKKNSNRCPKSSLVFLKAHLLPYFNQDNGDTSYYTDTEASNNDNSES